MTYRERRERRAQRLHEWADKREAKAQAASDTAHRIGDQIPFGQPILVGHHSERAHRRAVGRIDRATSQTVEHSRRAGDFRSRADNIEAAAERAIYSDDENAAERLREKIATLEAERQRIKRYNASCRKAAPDPSALDERQRRELESQRSIGWLNPDGSFRPYMTTNLGGTINRTRKRLAQIGG